MMKLFKCQQCSKDFERKPTWSRPNPKFCGHACNKRHQNTVRWHGDTTKTQEASSFFESLVDHSVAGDGERDGLKTNEDWVISSQAPGETWQKVQRSPEDLSLDVLSTRELYSALIGMVLGDGNLQLRPTGARLQIAHSQKQADYVAFKSRIVSQLPGVRSTFKDIRNMQRQLGIMYDYTRLWTNSHPIFTKLRSTMYTPIKKIDAQLLRYITPLGLAIWYMDDGSLVSNAVSLSTYCFSKAENELICRWLQERFGVTAGLTETKRATTSWSIKLRTEMSKRFLEIVSPYVSLVPCMRYKMMLKYKDRTVDLTCAGFGSMVKGHERTAPLSNVDGVMI